MQQSYNVQTIYCLLLCVHEIIHALFEHLSCSTCLFVVLPSGVAFPIRPMGLFSLHRMLLAIFAYMKSVVEIAALIISSSFLRLNKFACGIESRRALSPINTHIALNNQSSTSSLYLRLTRLSSFLSSLCIYIYILSLFASLNIM